MCRLGAALHCGAGAHCRPGHHAQPLVVAAAAAHLGTALVCLEAWRRSVRCPPLGAWRASRRVAAGLCDSIWRLAPAPSSSSSALAALLPLPLGGSDGGGGGGGASVGRVYEQQRQRAAEYATLAVAFGGFTLLSLLAPFPLATLPSLMGKRLARASGGWTWLAAVVFFVLKEEQDASTGELSLGLSSSSSKKSFMFLRRGALGMSLSHLCVAVVRPLVDPDGASVYPAAMACLPATALSLLVHILAAVTTSSSLSSSSFSSVVVVVVVVVVVAVVVVVVVDRGDVGGRGEERSGVCGEWLEPRAA